MPGTCVPAAAAVRTRGRPLAVGRRDDACYPRHRNGELLAFLKQVAKAHPRVQLHVVCDNYAAHSHPNAKEWLAKNPRITLHFTPTGASWMNLVEIFFGIITRQAIRRGTFTSVPDLIGAIRAFIDAYNHRCQPFTWTKSAEQILAKATRPSSSRRRVALGSTSRRNVRHGKINGVRAALKRLHLDPDPSTLPDDPSEFALRAGMIVGTPDTPGEESFDVTVCSPQWLAKTCREVGGIYNARHHLVVDVEDFDVRTLRAWLTARVQDIEADTWSVIGERLGRLGHWEFEDYRS